MNSRKKGVILFICFMIFVDVIFSVSSIVQPEDIGCCTNHYALPAVRCIYSANDPGTFTTAYQCCGDSGNDEYNDCTNNFFYFGVSCRSVDACKNVGCCCPISNYENPIITTKAECGADFIESGDIDENSDSSECVPVCGGNGQVPQESDGQESNSNQEQCVYYFDSTLGENGKFIKVTGTLSDYLNSISDNVVAMTYYSPDSTIFAVDIDGYVYACTPGSTWFDCENAGTLESVFPQIHNTLDMLSYYNNVFYMIEDETNNIFYYDTELSQSETLNEFLSQSCFYDKYPNEMLNAVNGCYIMDNLIVFADNENDKFFFLDTTPSSEEPGNTCADKWGDVDYDDLNIPASGIDALLYTGDIFAIAACDEHTSMYSLLNNQQRDKLINIDPSDLLDYNNRVTILNDPDLSALIAHLSTLDNDELRAALSCESNDDECKKISFNLISLLAYNKAGTNQAINIPGDMVVIYFAPTIDPTEDIEASKYTPGETTVNIVDNMLDSSKEIDGYFSGHTDATADAIPLSLPDSKIITLMPPDNLADADKERLKTNVKDFLDIYLGRNNEGKIPYSYTYAISSYLYLMRAKAVKDGMLMADGSIDYDRLLEKINDVYALHDVVLSDDELYTLGYILRLPIIPEYSFKTDQFSFDDAEADYETAFSSVFDAGGGIIDSSWFDREIYCSQNVYFALLAAYSQIDGSVSSNKVMYKDKNSNSLCTDTSKSVISPQDLLIFLIKDMGWDIIFSNIDGYTESSDILSLQNQLRNSPSSYPSFDTMAPESLCKPIDTESPEYADRLEQRVSDAMDGFSWADLIDIGHGYITALGNVGGDRTESEVAAAAFSIRHGAIDTGWYTAGYDTDKLNQNIGSLVEKLINFPSPYYQSIYGASCTSSNDCDDMTCYTKACVTEHCSYTYDDLDNCDSCSMLYCRCNSGECVPGCSSDDDCGSEVCNELTGECMQCVNNDDCPLSNNPCHENLCIANQCVDTIDNTLSCTQCNAGRCDCSEGLCVEDCQSDGDCNSPEICNMQTGQCVECTGNDDCQDRPCQSKSCINNLCVYSADNNLQCSNCGKANCKCLDGSCVVYCFIDTDCDDGNVCDTTTGNCVECISVDDCPDRSCQSKSCTLNSCEYLPDDNLDCSECNAGSCGCSHGECIGLCTDDNDCGSQTPICNQNTGQCVECTDSTQCPDHDCYSKTCNTDNHLCTYTALESGTQCSSCPGQGGCSCLDGQCMSGCTADSECTGVSDKSKCMLSTGDCVECLDSADCPEKSCQTLDGCFSSICRYSYEQDNGDACSCDEGDCVCNLGSCIAMCYDDNDCTDPDRPYCNGGKCNECMYDNDCDDGNDCTADSCSADNVCLNEPFANGTTCGSGGHCCSGYCFETSINQNFDPDCREGPICVDNIWQYQPAYDGLVCNGSCTVCSNGYCGYDSSYLCLNDQLCIDGQCGSCTDQCEINSTQCIGINQIQKCEIHNDCKLWGEPTLCPDHKCKEPTCNNGECSEIFVPSGNIDESCFADHGCSGNDCQCNGNGECFSFCEDDDDCNDNNPCTVDRCLAGGHCRSKAKQDGTICPGGRCCGGQCSKTPNNANFDEKCRTGPECIGGSWEYIPANDTQLCNGSCTVCTNGYCSYDNSSLCPDNGICTDGVCGGCENICTPGERECIDQANFHVCITQNGCNIWSIPEKCPDKICFEPRCSDGYCNSAFVGKGMTDESCYIYSGCNDNDCVCDGFGHCRSLDTIQKEDLSTANKEKAIHTESSSHFIAESLKNTCNEDTICDPGENYNNCPSDCPSGSADNYCDGALDERCDPDCEQEDDKDCKGENNLFSWILLAITIIVTIGISGAVEFYLREDKSLVRRLMQDMKLGLAKKNNRVERQFGMQKKIQPTIMRKRQQQYPKRNIYPNNIKLTKESEKLLYYYKNTMMKTGKRDPHIEQELLKKGIPWETIMVNVKKVLSERIKTKNRNEILKSFEK